MENQEKVELVEPITEGVDGGEKYQKERELIEELEVVLRRHNRQEYSGTPNFLVAEFLVYCLRGYESTARQSKGWNGEPPAEIKRDEDKAIRLNHIAGMAIPNAYIVEGNDVNGIGIVHVNVHDDQAISYEIAELGAEVSKVILEAVAKVREQPIDGKD